MFKKIEMVGFKSFADKLSVDFDKGITGVVGPNGCGKSNISDAIRWVLGEQSSKALRGSNMQDVIFKGSDLRKQLGYCEVSLHFDNANRHFAVPYEEVVLSRKLYRSGESEYCINRQPSRLKDITTLLHDSGIDRDGLTIIGQGQVADIVNSKPEARRGIFEEAAGIAKFKARETEAKRKLERVAGELVRVNDVIGEIERSLNPLLKQAEVARKYLAFKEQLKSLEINMFIHTYDNVANTKAELTAELNRTKNDLDLKQVEIDNLGAAGTRALNELSTIDTRAEAIREQILNLSLGLERHKGEGIRVAEKVTMLCDKRNEAISEHISLREKIEFDTAQVARGTALLESMRSDRSTVKSELEKATAELEKVNKDADKLNGLLQKRERLLERKETLEQLMQSGEGFKFSVKKLVSNMQKNDIIKRNIIGVVAKEISVPAELETAIEVALGAAAQNIITENEDNARAMIDLLKRENWGRATFLPLTSAKVKTLSQPERTSLRCSSVVGVASELVEYDNKISDAIESLLGRTVIVDTLPNAIDLARNVRHSFKIVTLDGDVIETRGAITGGSKNTVNNHLWHKNSLAEIEKELEKINSIVGANCVRPLGEVQEEVTALRIKDAAMGSEIASMAEGLDSRTEALQLLKNTFNDKHNSLLGLEREIDGLKLLSASEDEVRLYNDAVARLDAARRELDGFDARKEELRTIITTSDEQKDAAIDAARALHETYYRVQAKLERVDDDITAMQEKIWDDYGLNYSSCYEFKVIDFVASTANEEIRSLRRDITKLGNVNVDAIEQSAEAAERYESYTTQVTDLTAAKTDLEKVIADLAVEMETRFRTTFDAINQNFGEVFRDLFGGGRAKLLLTDENDYLNSGIEIIAEPTGKKLQNLTLLSGGEKALTAIAILFAILKLKPMPFCLLDEIEAALDEANVVRFASYLKNVRDTQFIVITHRKPTMELCDHLYGVTMQEKGVSKIVSVRLEQYA